MNIFEKVLNYLEKSKSDLFKQAKVSQRFGSEKDKFCKKYAKYCWKNK